MTEPISVLIVDAHPVVRRGLRALLEVQDGIEVAGEAGDGATALALAAELSPDVVLLDLKLPGMDGIAVLTQLKANGSQARVLVLTSATEPASASLALRSGAAGVVYKDVDPDALVRAIRAVHDGHLLLAPEAAGSLVRNGGSWNPAAGLDATPHAVADQAPDAILNTASSVGADLIVVGSKGMRGARRVLGSVPNSVAHGADCAVLIVKTD